MVINKTEHESISRKKKKQLGDLEFLINMSWGLYRVFRGRMDDPRRLPQQVWYLNAPYCNFRPAGPTALRKSSVLQLSGSYRHHFLQMDAFQLKEECTGVHLRCVFCEL